MSSVATQDAAAASQTFTEPSSDPLARRPAPSTARACTLSPSAPGAAAAPRGPAPARASGVGGSGDAESGRALQGSFERLYRNEILQVNMRWKALAEIYTMHSFAQLCNLKIVSKFPKISLKFARSRSSGKISIKNRIFMTTFKQIFRKDVF